MHVHVNAAASLDGRLSSQCREQVTISDDNDFIRVDKIRTTVSAVAVGVRTVLTGDPYLTPDDPGLVAACEDRDDLPHPARVVADSRARTPTDTQVLDDAATIYLLVSEAAPGGRREAFRAAGAELVVAGAEWVPSLDAFDALEARGINRLMIEGGGELIFPLFGAGLVDELTLYVGSLVIDGHDTPALTDSDKSIPDFPRLSLHDVERINDGVLLTYDY